MWVQLKNKLFSILKILRFPKHKQTFGCYAVFRQVLKEKLARLQTYSSESTKFCGLCPSVNHPQCLSCGTFHTVYYANCVAFTAQLGQPA